MRPAVVIIALSALMLASPAHAQDRPVTFIIGAGVTATAGEIKTNFGSGFNIDLGATFRLTDAIGFQAEYQFNDFGRKQVDLATNLPTDAPTTFDVKHRMHVGAFDLVFKPKMNGGASGYLLVGPGVYNRSVDLTTPGVGYVRVCNPWWYICYGGPVAVDKVIGSRGSTDIGINFGGGVSFPLGDSASFYVEARYHYIWGPTVDDPTTGEAVKANGKYFPITAGFRF